MLTLRFEYLQAIFEYLQAIFVKNKLLYKRYIQKILLQYEPRFKLSSPIFKSINLFKKHIKIAPSIFQYIVYK